MQAKGLAVNKREAKEERGGGRRTRRRKKKKKKSRFQTAQIKKFVITTKLRSKATHGGPCRPADLTKPSPSFFFFSLFFFWRPSCKKCHLMNLSAEAVPCLSEVSASDKRWGPPPPVTDRPASWRLRPQSNHATRKKGETGALLLVCHAQGLGRRGWWWWRWRSRGRRAQAFCFHAGPSTPPH